MPAPSQSIIFTWGGEVARRGGGQRRWPSATRAWVLHPFCLWEDATRRRQADHVGPALPRASSQPWTTGGTYLNFIGDEGEDRVRAAFGEPTTASPR